MTNCVYFAWQAKGSFLVLGNASQTLQSCQISMTELAFLFFHLNQTYLQCIRSTPGSSRLCLSRILCKNIALLLIAFTHCRSLSQGKKIGLTNFISSHAEEICHSISITSISTSTIVLHRISRTRSRIWHSRRRRPRSRPWCCSWTRGGIVRQNPPSPYRKENLWCWFVATNQLCLAYTANDTHVARCCIASLSCVFVYVRLVSHAQLLAGRVLPKEMDGLENPDKLFLQYKVHLYTQIQKHKLTFQYGVLGVFFTLIGGGPPPPYPAGQRMVCETTTTILSIRITRRCMTNNFVLSLVRCAWQIHDLQTRTYYMKCMTDFTYTYSQKRIQTWAGVQRPGNRALRLRIKCKSVWVWNILRLVMHVLHWPWCLWCMP